MSNGTQSALDSMTQAILERKSDVAGAAGQGRPVLTPVGMEERRMAPPADDRDEPINLGGKHPAPFPFDDGQTVEDAIKHGLKLVEGIRVELEHVETGLVALFGVYGFGVTQPAPPPEDAAKQAEREADARFAAEFKAKQEEAQAAAYAATPDESVVYTGWQCPTHGAASLIEKTSPKGRQYMACTQCSQFER